MPEQWRAVHAFTGCQTLTGVARVDRGHSVLSRIIGYVFRFPAASDTVPVSVEMCQTDDGELWVRNFGQSQFRSKLTYAGNGRLYERFGTFKFELSLPVQNSEMAMPVARGWFLGIPLPKWILPESETREYVEESRFRFDVRLSAPLAGFIVHYQGWLEIEDQPH